MAGGGVKLRVKPRNGRGRLQHFDVLACMWPRSRYSHPGPHKRVRENVQKDLDEVRAYMASHPGCTIFDVALECHMSDNHASRLIRDAA